MKRATCRLAGWPYTSRGGAICCDDTILHDDDAIGKRQRFVLIVRHVDGRAVELAVDAADLGTRLDAQLGVEIGQRLVHQDQRRLDDNRPRDRDALLLATGKLTGQLVLLPSELDHLHGPPHPRRDVGSGHAPHPQAEVDVRRHTHVRERARSSGTPCRNHAAQEAACRCACRPARCFRPTVAGARQCSSTPSTCRTRKARGAR